MDGTNLTGRDNFNGVHTVMSWHFKITKHVAVKNYYSLLPVSIILHVSVHVCKNVKFVNSQINNIQLAYTLMFYICSDMPDDGPHGLKHAYY